jgi:type II secretory pathway component PulM
MSSRGITHVIDAVLDAANAAVQQKTAEVAAIKVAAAQPKTSMARDLRALADSTRNVSDAVSYADLLGAL